MAFSKDNLGQPAPEKHKTFRDFNEARDDGVDHMQIIFTSIGTDNHTSTSTLDLHGPDDLPDAQPTVSKH